MSSISMMQYGNIDTDMSLFDVISGYSFRALNDFRHKLEIPSEDYKNKEELIQLIVCRVKAKFTEKIPCLDYKRYSILKSISDGNDDSMECDGRSLYSFVIIEMALEHHSGGEVKFILPDELIDAFRNQDTPDMMENARQNSKLYDLLNGCISSYGLIDSARLKQIVNRHAGFEFDNERFQKAMANCEALHGMILVDEPLVYSRCFKDPEYYIKEQSKLKEFDYKEFSREELIQAADVMYVPESPCYWKLMQLLKKYFRCSDKMCRSSAAVLINYAKACRDIDETMKYIVRELGLLTGGFIGEFMPLYCEYNNCTGKWTLKGYTPNEIMKEQNPDLHEEFLSMQDMENGPGRVLPFMADQRAGRNSLCPCGSGKKYKNCCGRN